MLTIIVNLCTCHHLPALIPQVGWAQQVFLHFPLALSFHHSVLSYPRQVGRCIISTKCMHLCKFYNEFSQYLSVIDADKSLCGCSSKSAMNIKKAHLIRSITSPRDRLATCMHSNEAFIESEQFTL